MQLHKPYFVQSLQYTILYYTTNLCLNGDFFEFFIIFFTINKLWLYTVKNKTSINKTF